MLNGSLEYTDLGNGVASIQMKAPSKPTAKVDKTLKIIAFGEGNNYPQQLIDINSRSPLNNACLLTASKFLYGDGFLFPDKEKPEFIKVSDAVKAAGLDNHLLSKVTYDEAFFETICLRVTFRPNGKIAKIYHFDPSMVRLTAPAQGEYEPTHAKISTDWENSKKPEHKPFEVELYDPKRALDFINENRNKPEMLTNWFGQLVYYKKYRAGQTYYSLPAWSTAANWVYVDGEIGKFQANNIDNGFFPSTILLHKGDLAGKTENGKDKREAIKEALEEFQGAENSGKIFNLFSKDSASAPEVIQFNGNTNSELFDSLKAICDKQIGNAWGIPNALINVETPGKLGNSKEIAEATQLYQATKVRPEQDHILELVYKLIENIPGYVPGFEIDIANSTPVTFIDEALLPDLSKGERRALMGYPEKAPGEDVGSETLLIERIGVGGATALTDILTQVGAGQIKQDQASNTMQILFGLSKEDADRIVYGDGGSNAL